MQKKKRDILRLLSAPARYIKRKVNSIYKNQYKKTDNGVNKSIDELKSESSNAERNYMKYLNNNNNNNNNSNSNTNVDNNSNMMILMIVK